MKVIRDFVYGVNVVKSNKHVIKFFFSDLHKKLLDREIGFCLILISTRIKHVRKFGVIFQKTTSVNGAPVNIHIIRTDLTSWFQMCITLGSISSIWPFSVEKMVKSEKICHYRFDISFSLIEIFYICTSSVQVHWRDQLRFWQSTFQKKEIEIFSPSSCQVI